MSFNLNCQNILPVILTYPSIAMPYHTDKIKIKIQEKKRNFSKYIGMETNEKYGNREKFNSQPVIRGCGASAPGH